MKNSAESVVIVGVGARTPLGLDMHSSAAAVRGGLSAMADHPHILDKAGEPVSVAMDPLLGPECTGIERFCALARSPMEEALRPLFLDRRSHFRFLTMIGLPESRPGLSPELNREIMNRLADPKAAMLPSGAIATISGGHSAGLMALEEGCRQIRQGEADFCLIGGVDSYIDPDTLEWLDREGQLMSGENRSGFPPGEGAAFCLLASLEAAQASQLKILAEVTAVATTQEENRIKTDTVCTGVGLSQAILRAADALRLPEEKIDFTYCDLNGERYRSEESTFTVLRTQSVFVEASDNLTPCDCWGDIGSASGPLFANLAVAAARRGYAKGPRSLLWTSSEGGNRAAAILCIRGSDGASLCR